MALGERRVLDPTPGIQKARVPQLKEIPFVGIALMIASGATLLLAYQWSLEHWSLSRSTIAQGELYRVLTTVITHGGPLHLFMNMSVVATLGFTLERVIASWRMLLISLITALGSATVVLLFSPDVPTVGASGMILGWVGAMLPIATRQGRRTIGMWLIQVAIISLIPGVSWQGHLGGFLFGLPCGLLLKDKAKHFAIAAPALLLATVGALMMAISRVTGGG